MRLNERQIRTLIRKVIAEVTRPKSRRVIRQKDFDKLLEQASKTREWSKDFRPYSNKERTPEFLDWVEFRKELGKEQGIYVNDDGLSDDDGQDDFDQDFEFQSPQDNDDEGGEDFRDIQEPYTNNKDKYSLDAPGWDNEWDDEEDDYYPGKKGNIRESDDSKEKSDEGYILTKSSRKGSGKVKKSDAYKSKVYKTRKEASAAAKELKKDNPVGFDVRKIGDDF